MPRFSITNPVYSRQLRNHCNNLPNRRSRPRNRGDQLTIEASVENDTSYPSHLTLKAFKVVNETSLSPTDVTLPAPSPTKVEVSLNFWLMSRLGGRIDTEVRKERGDGDSLGPDARERDARKDLVSCEIAARSLVEIASARIYAQSMRFAHPLAAQRQLAMRSFR